MPRVTRRCPCPPQLAFNLFIQIITLLVTVPIQPPHPVMHSSAPRHIVQWPRLPGSLIPAYSQIFRRDECCWLGWESCKLLVQHLDAGRGLAGSKTKSLPTHPGPCWLRWEGQKGSLMCGTFTRAYYNDKNRLAKLKITKQIKERTALRLGWTYGPKEPRNKNKKRYHTLPLGLKDKTGKKYKKQKVILNLPQVLKRAEKEKSLSLPGT